MADVTPAPKPVIERDAAKVDWVRSLPCALCAAPPPSEPHHVRVRQHGDGWTIPVCRACHDRAHRGGAARPMLVALAEAYATRWRAVARTAVAW